MKNLLIIGAGGFGVDIYELAKESRGYMVNFQIKGFLDKNLNALNNYDNYPKVIEYEDNYNIQENDIFVCAIGDVNVRKKCIEKMEHRGAHFLTLIHNTAFIAPSCQIGDGCIILQDAKIGTDVIVGKHCLIQLNAIIAHNCVLGDYNRIDCNVVCVGGVKVKNNVTIHTSAVINHKVTIGNNATVGACSFVIRSVKEGATVYGNPARSL